MNLNKKGISLIVLVITIIVIIILAGSTILTLSANNPITQATEAQLKNNAALVKESLNMYAGTELAKSGGTFDIAKINGKLSSYLGISSGSDMDKQFYIENGKIVAVEKYMSEDNLLSLLNSGMSSIYNYGLTGVAQIACGYNYTVVLMTDGTVKAWGDNSYGQLGDGTTVNKLSPTTVPGLTGVKQVSCSDSSTYAILTNGTVKVWGANGWGQLGLGDTNHRSTPTTASSLANAKQIEGGQYFAAALMSDGTVKTMRYEY